MNEVLDDLVASGVGSEMPVLVLGRGSNLVVADSGFQGLVIRLGPSFGGVESRRARRCVPAPPHRWRRWRGAAWTPVSTGLEFFIGVPGSVGGAVRQNAGCFGSETRDRLIEAAILDLTDGKVGTFGPDDLDLSYRHSNVTPTRVVAAARSFQASPGDIDTGPRRTASDHPMAP